MGLYRNSQIKKSCLLGNSTHVSSATSRQNRSSSLADDFHSLCVCSDFRDSALLISKTPSVFDNFVLHLQDSSSVTFCLRLVSFSSHDLWPRQTATREEQRATKDEEEEERERGVLLAAEQRQTDGRRQQLSICNQKKACGGIRAAAAIIQRLSGASTPTITCC